MKPKTVEWNPPTAEELPCNWLVQAIGLDGGAYKSRDGLIVIISGSIEKDGYSWVHLSLSRKKSVPTWIDLVKVKELFLGADSVAIQILPPRSEWVNVHEFCLHLYQCLDERPVPDFRKLGTI
ncbi:DUF7694 domain-containing protein [Microcoleus sp. OTE_8_concoct_300]|uniref:DUF7694 domain-containing protein n=1 Tax=Microcoleus sp. OTE_8_concoct_300 TaxID=2964710 RepID=UPI00403F6BCE